MQVISARVQLDSDVHKLSPRQVARLVTAVRCRGGSAVADGPTGRWSVDLSDRVLLVTYRPRDGAPLPNWKDA